MNNFERIHLSGLAARCCALVADGYHADAYRILTHSASQMAQLYTPFAWAYFLRRLDEIALRNITAGYVRTPSPLGFFCAFAYIPEHASTR